MENEPDQEALFELQGPDENGCVWACSPEGSAEAWCQNLGPADKVAEVLSHWLDASPVPELSLAEIKERFADRARKAASPGDHRDESGQGSGHSDR